MSPNPKRERAKPGSSLRVRVVRSLCEIAEGNSGSQQQVHELVSQLKDARDRGLATELLYSSLRYAPAFLGELDEYLKRGVDRTDTKMVWCLVMGMVQLRILDRMPPHAAVGSAVDAARAMCGESGSRLVNAILRRVQRGMKDRPDLPDPKDCYAPHILQTFRGLPGVDVEEASHAYLQRAPHVIRGLGPGYGDMDGIRAALESMGVSEVIEGRVPGSIVLPSGSDGALKDTKKRWIPQDEASQAIGRLAGTLAKELAEIPRVLDACAGRGVKAEQIRAIVGSDAHLVAADRSREKLEDARALVEAEFFCGDLTKKLPGHEGAFDLVFVDAPCSGLGVLRRRPEIRLRRTAADLQTLGEIQGGLLANLSRLVRPGGVLLYAVCTFNEKEGPQRARGFLGSEAGRDFDLHPLPAPSVKEWANPDGSWCTYDAPSYPHLADTFYTTAFRRKL